MAFINMNQAYYMVAVRIEDQEEPLFFYNKHSEEIERADEICDKLHMGIKDFIPSDYDYIPLCFIKEHIILRKYIESTNDKKIQSAFNNVEDKQLFAEFHRFFHSSPQYSFLLNDYSKFCYNFCKNLLINWCKENGLQYKNR